MLPRLVPSWPRIMQIRISFRSRSDLVLDADQALDLLSDLASQACISFCSVSPCLHESALAHIYIYIYICICQRPHLVGTFLGFKMSKSRGREEKLRLWPGSAPTDPEAPKSSKTQKSDSRVTFGAPAKVTQKLLKSDLKVAKKWFFRPF